MPPQDALEEKRQPARLRREQPRREVRGDPAARPGAEAPGAGRLGGEGHQLVGAEPAALERGRERQAAVIREMTKIYEEVIPGSLGELAERFENKPVKGEIVIVVEGVRAAGKRSRTEG